MPWAAKWWTCSPQLPQKHWTILIVDPWGKMIDVRKKLGLLSITLYKILFHLSFTIQKPLRLVLFKDYLHLNCEDIEEYLYLWLRLKAESSVVSSFLKQYSLKHPKALNVLQYLVEISLARTIQWGQQSKKEKKCLYFLLGWSQTYIPVE